MAKRKAVAVKRIVNALQEFSDGLAAIPSENPAHYHAGGIEAIDVIEAFWLDFHLGNVVKYVLRHGRKNPADDLSDLRKARWYLDRAIQRRCKSAADKCVEAIRNGKT